MKKSLFAVAAATAFAGAAQAQSSVTVYGLLDVGFNSLTSVQSNYPTTATGTTLSGQRQVTNSSGFGGAGNQSTSRIGFRGTEDLGGGTSAFFTIEMAVLPSGTTGALSSAGSANRQTFVGLAQKGIGRVSIGTQFTPIHLGAAATSAGQLNNIVGDVIYPNAGTPSRDGVTNTQLDGATFGYVVRAANSIYFQSDRMAGFTGKLFYTQNNTTSPQSTPAGGGAGNSFDGGPNNNSGWGIGLDYSWKKLLVTANYQSFKSENAWGKISYSPSCASAAGGACTSATASAGRPVAWGVGGGNTSGTNAIDTGMFFGATYDFGILKAYAQYLDRKITSNINSNQYAKRSAQQIGVRGNITKTVEGWASVGSGRVQSFGQGQPTANFTGWQVGTSYSLSKRTNLYAIYGATGTSNVSTVNGANPSSSNYSQYAVGARHTF